MPQYLIMIDKRKWDRDVNWLAQGQIQADPLGDLRAKNGALSVWLIDDEKSNFELIVTALAGNRNEIDNFEYGLFDHDIVSQLGIEIEEALGKTQIEQANRWHRDLIHLTVDKLVRLVNTIFWSLEKGILVKDEVRKIGQSIISQGDIVVPEKIRKKFNQP